MFVLSKNACQVDSILNIEKLKLMLYLDKYMQVTANTRFDSHFLETTGKEIEVC